MIQHGDEILESDVTKSNGTILVDLPKGLPGITLRLPDRALIYTLDVAALSPLSELGGAQGRLSNLGYPCPSHGEFDDATKDALLAFQHDHHLTPTGELDGATLAALHEAHDV